MEIITTQSLRKSFGPRRAIDGISIQVRQGEIYGFLGLNGAGKTTLIRMLLGMIKPDGGELYLFGQKLTPQVDFWNQVGYLVETPYSYPNLSVVENLRVYYHLRQLKDPALVPAIIDKLKLGTYRNTKARYLSLGNQQRLGLAKAFMHQPRLLLLDEPINGLDPEGIVEVRELLHELVQAGSTVFLSSHILGEVSKVAHRIGIIHEGRLVKELSTPELKAQLHRKLVVSTPDNGRAEEVLIQAGHQVRTTGAGDMEVTDERALDGPEYLSKLLVEKGFPPRQVYTEIEDLEMYFLRTIRSKTE